MYVWRGKIAPQMLLVLLLQLQPQQLHRLQFKLRQLQHKLHRQRYQQQLLRLTRQQPIN
jgi:hypothetical protein